jgi:hypothetical protein
MAGGLDKMAMPISLSPICMNRCVFGSGHQLKVRRGVVQGVTVDMMDVLSGEKLPVQKLLHDDAMLGFIVPLPDHDVPVSVLDVDADEDLMADRFSIPPVESVMVPAETFSRNRQGASFDGTRGGTAVHFRSDVGVTMTTESMVVHPTHPFDDGFSDAGINRTFHVKFSLSDTAYIGLGNESSGLGGFVWLN